ncbi:cytochrome c oxidase assembly protein COX20, mitochondrial isoform X3 [Gambusia affinis]|uniref:cytochrome c oxidase assembly protein COX20, mitochondrial isoform X3 n=1 Tax=Gambusia affinis TaxID=33528 RepID=UPI000F300508|nr:cytochrome c oxidase assembly protein COX20, mitochondrial isoform X3 [Gambusia affinis]
MRNSSSVTNIIVQCGFLSYQLPRRRARLYTDGRRRRGRPGKGRVRRSFDVGFAGFMLTTLGSWFYCRMNNIKIRVQQRVIQEGIRNQVVYEGTSLDPTNKPRADAPSGSS